MSEDIRQSVLVAGTLIDQYDQVVKRLLVARAEGNDPEEHVLRGEIERVYGAVWEHLDGAARASRGSGRVVDEYDRIRATPGLETAVAVDEIGDGVIDIAHKPKIMEVTIEARVTHNKGGIALARQGAQALRDAWPELDWTVHAEPDVDLRPWSSRIVGGLAKIFGRRTRKIVG